MVNGKNREDCLNGSSGAEQMAYSSLRATDIYICRPLPSLVSQEKRFDGHILGRITQDCRSCVGIDVINGARWELCMLQSSFHGKERALSVFSRSSHMVGICRKAIAFELCVDSGTSSFGVLKFLSTH